MSTGSIRTRLRRLESEDVVFLWVKYTAITLLVGMVVIPYLFVFSVSFRTTSEFFAQTVYLIPKQPTFESWVEGFNKLAPHLKNSALAGLGTAIFALSVTIPGAYAFGRLDFPAKEIAFYIIVLSLFFPFIVLIIPISDIWYDIGLFDTIPGLILAYQTTTTPFAIWILRDFFAKLPRDLEEAAMVYGCTRFTAFLRVILPLAAPGIIAVGFLAFLGAWNDYLFANMLTTGSGVEPAVVTLFKSTQSGERTFWGLVMAESLIIGLPPAVLYLVARRYLSNAFAVG